MISVTRGTVDAAGFEAPEEALPLEPPPHAASARVQMASGHSHEFIGRMASDANGSDNAANVGGSITLKRKAVQPDS
jgi:hypothetical protein